MKIDLSDGSLVGPWYFGPNEDGKYMAAIGCGHCGFQFSSPWMGKGRAPNTDPRKRALAFVQTKLKKHACATSS